MIKTPSLANSLDWIVALGAAIGILGVLKTFIIGKHYIIPTALLALTVLLANLAWYGLKNYKWAKHVNGWIGFILTCHLFFGVFWAKTPRKLLGDSFEPIAIILTVLMLLLTGFYVRKNTLL